MRTQTRLFLPIVSTFFFLSIAAWPEANIPVLEHQSAGVAVFVSCDQHAMGQK